MIDFASFSDELVKISAPRWKQLLRAGELGAKEVKRLTGSGVLNYGKELAGLERGNIALQRHLGTPARTIRGALAHGVKTSLKEKTPQALAENVFQATRTPELGGLSAFFFGGRPSLVKSKTFFKAPGSTKEVRRATDALTLRHELDEVRSGLRQLKRGKGLQPKFRTYKRPETWSEHVVERRLGRQRRQIRFLKNQKNPVLRGAGEGMEQGGELGGMGNPLKIPVGKVPAGIHNSPDVILRESQNVATMHPSVRWAMQPSRRGEQAALKTVGLRYGQAPLRKDLPGVIKKLETS